MVEILQFLLILGGILITSLMVFLAVMALSLLARTVWEDFRKEFLGRDR